MLKLMMFASYRSCSFKQSLILVFRLTVDFREAPAIGKSQATFSKEDTSNNVSLRGKKKGSFKIPYSFILRIQQFE